MTIVGPAPSLSTVNLAEISQNEQIVNGHSPSTGAPLVVSAGPPPPLTVARELGQKTIHVPAGHLALDQAQQTATPLFQPQRDSPLRGQAFQRSASSPLPQPARQANPDRNVRRRKGRRQTTHKVREAIPTPIQLTEPILRKFRRAEAKAARRRLIFAHGVRAGGQDRSL
jgi:hypothetical protein